MVTMTKTERELKPAEKMRMVKPKEIALFGIVPVYLRLLELAALNVCRFPNHKLIPHHQLTKVKKRIPEGVVCFPSANYFPDLLKNPSDVRLAIDRNIRRMLRKPINEQAIEGNCLFSGHVCITEASV
jgi:hypothetical protein